MKQFVSKTPDLVMAQKVRYALSTQSLKVQSFATLHSQLVNLEEFKELLEDPQLAPFAMKYQSSVVQLQQYRTDLDSVTLDSSDTSTSLKDCKSEISVLAGATRKSCKSKSAIVQPVAQKIYKAYQEACNGNRINVNNADDIIGTLVEKLIKIPQKDLKAAGYEESVTYIMDEYQKYCTLRANLTKNAASYSKTYERLIKQREIVEATYQWFVMALSSNIYISGSVHGTLLDMLRKKGGRVPHNRPHFCQTQEG
jgi:hypothetical protein